MREGLNKSHWGGNTIWGKLWLLDVCQVVYVFISLSVSFLALRLGGMLPLWAVLCLYLIAAIINVCICVHWCMCNTFIMMLCVEQNRAWLAASNWNVSFQKRRHEPVPAAPLIRLFFTQALIRRWWFRSVFQFTYDNTTACVFQNIQFIRNARVIWNIQMRIIYISLWLVGRVFYIMTQQLSLVSLSGLFPKKRILYNWVTFLILGVIK